MNCARCASAARGEAVRGRRLWRCMDPRGVLRDPVTGEPSGSTLGYSVGRPVPENADVERTGIEAPVWCPRRANVGKAGEIT